MDETTIRETLPEIDEITDDQLRQGVIDAWQHGLALHDVTDISTVPWYPPVEDDIGLTDEFLVDHVREVTACSVALAEAFADRDAVDIDMDVVRAGALVHDISKLAEFDGREETPVHELLEHPHYGVHLVEQAGLPTEIAHIVLSHTHRSGVDPKTLEAVIVNRADQVAATVIQAQATDDMTQL